MNAVKIQEEYVRAGRPDTPIAELSELARSANVAVRRRVGENERTSSETLKSLASDPEPEVRIAVGLGRFTPADIVSGLVHDKHDDVRYWLASAGYLPKHLLEQLAEDDNPYVEDRAKRTLERIGRSSGMLLNVFEFLSEDHGSIIKKLETLIENYLTWPQQIRSEKASEILDDIRVHLERRHILCAHWFDVQSGLSVDIARKCLLDQEGIIDRTSWLLAQGAPEPESSAQLDSLLEQIRKHRDFVENELFPEVKKHVPQAEIDAINERLNRTVALPKLGHRNIPAQASAILSHKVVVRSQHGKAYEHEIQDDSRSWKCDATREEGGDGSSPDPHSFLLGALGSCTSMTLLMYARRHGWDLKKVEITVSQEEIKTEGKAGPHQVRLIRDIAVDGALTDEQLARLKIVADKCPIHRLLVGSKESTTTVALMKSPDGKS